ncbi:carbon-nitrogen hydrolase family protein [Patulibacter defluvii]|uniref:carbon-nitrogen hydrolase family protein n=1 Tax=Patulibacter defluvii TaxID=3095358 RepID=UPI002A74D73F|nr:carbon-nitrogen hydrolase family protein [Patulibacter sp. DM4]
MTRIAVVQPALRLGAISENLARIEDLVRDAHREHAPDVILLPEACSSPNVFARVLRDAALPVDGQAFQLLTRLARELECVVGGGFLAVRGRHAYGTYVLAEPDGAAHLHDKDQPSAWENAFYRGGDDDGVVRCGAVDATVGLTSGWELARFRTARRLLEGGVRAVLGGMCWPSMPSNWPGPLGRWMAHEHREWARHQRELPARVARLTGVPVAMAAHVGPIVSETPMAPGLPWPTTMLGESQICDRDGTVLARLAGEDGEGHVAADVDLTLPPRPLDPLRERLWIPEVSTIVTKGIAWHGMNAHGRVTYRLRHARRGFGWQSLPAGDLPDEIAAADPATGPVAATVGR